METSELKKLQTIELDMLKKTVEICERHGIPYYALGGTLLGAVRHQGFIPWDDDIDIGIPRPWYNRFMWAAMRELPEEMTISHYRVNPVTKRPVYACQVLNKNYRLVQHIANKPIETYVWIDVFPLDGMPSNPILQKIHALYLLYRRMWIQFSMFDDNVHQHRENRPWYEKALIWLYQKTRIGADRDTAEMMRKLDRALERCSYERSGYLVNFMGTWKFKEMFPKTIYGSGKDMPFEDTTIRCPLDTDYVLRQMYGNYMEPKVTENHHAIELLDN